MRQPLIDRRSLLTTAGVLAGASTFGVSPIAAAADGGIETTEGETEPRYDLDEAESQYVEIEMTFENRDGEEVTETPSLYGEIIHPVDSAGQRITDVPVILTYSPYNDLYQALNGGESPAKDGIAEFFVPRGYARAQFDLIGTRNSGGYYDYGGIRERLSGKKLVDALGQKEWSNGRIGMIGGSYDGTTQLAAAIEAPEHLEAIVPQVAIDRWYDYRFHGACPWDTYGTPTLFDFGFGLIPPAAVDYPDELLDSLTTRVEPSNRLEHEIRSYEYDPTYDEFWIERDYRRRAENVDCAVMMEAGWEDRNVKRWGTTRFYEALSDDHDKRLVVGDWDHSAGQYPDIEALYHAWFDHWLVDDVETDVMNLPPVDVQSASSPRTQFDEWPPAARDELAFGFVDHDAEQGELELLGTGVSSFEDGSPPIGEDEMFDERSSGEDHLMFESRPLEDELRIAGHVSADLLVASEDDTWFTAVVYERGADGNARIFARGFWNSRFRSGIDDERETPTDRTYRVPIECWDIDWTVAEGSRLGLVVASDNDDWVRHDSSNEGTNQVVLEESSLRFDGIAEGLEAATFPTAALSRDTDASAYTAGQTARATVTADSTTEPTLVRDRVPDGWAVVGGDAHSVREIEGATYVEFDEPLESGESRRYYAEVAEDTGTYEYGPLEYSAAGELWAAASDTTESAVVVGLDTS
ncbi:CocE/NonD family hydrolase [Natronococcus wangiae]|uniref:CocE/NonD family hydrolase n=1 Tax=Natronococcus wangiae TaxID=3068275 RepID=UPI00273F5D97|nr:CocE/NonD family hydrolase [Natronococcus sp. AD5]